MTCPNCGGETYVTDSRPNDDSVRRRRECVEYKNRFSTVEIDTDYYTTLKPPNKRAVQKALQDTYADLTRRIYFILNIEERNNENETESGT